MRKVYLFTEHFAHTIRRDGASVVKTPKKEMKGTSKQNEGRKQKK